MFVAGHESSVSWLRDPCAEIEPVGVWSTLGSIMLFIRSLSALTVKLTYCPVPASMPAAREIWDCASGLGTLVAVMVSFMNQPGSTPPDPGRIRKSFRTYWFSLKTPLRDGRSATQPEPAHSDARAPV